jgi:flagellar basal body rod protein FlgG
MRAAERRMEAITANLANVNTTAHKGTRSVTRAFVVPGSNGLQREVATRHIRNWSQGDYQPTGQTFDLALEGQGFFAAEGPKGEVFTRNGAFRMDSNGVLLTQEGYAVAWEGSRGDINPLGDVPVVDSSGTVHQGTGVVGRLKLVAFADRSVLSDEPNGYYSAEANAERIPTDVTVRQGGLERSNISAIDELVAMIRVQRSFEAANSLMRKIDETYSRLNNARM